MNKMINNESSGVGVGIANAFLSHGKIAMTVKDAAAVSGLGKTTLYALMSSGVLPRVKVGSRTLIRQDDLDRILQTGSPVKSAVHASIH